MNNNYKIKETPNVSEASSFEDRTYILEKPVPHIGVETLRPTTYRGIIQSLKDTTRKAANTAKRK